MAWRRTPLILAALLVLRCGAADGDVLLPYQSGARHLGVASCASSVCHGSVTSSGTHDVRLDEFVTWSHQDKHSQAYAVLGAEKGRAIAAKLGIADARTDKGCLDCHSDDVPGAQRSPGFTLSDGVGCEACHGGAERWIASHASREASYDADIAQGMYPTAQLRERAALCMSCHYGNRDKLATHRMMGAGHPRLAFELGTFLALQPPHYQLDADYSRRKPVYPRVQVWAYGQLALAGRQLELLQGPLVRRASFVPELALLDCHTCHENPLHRLDWARTDLTRLTQPGAAPFPKGHLEMAVIIARRLDEPAAAEMVVRGQALQRAAGEDSEHIVAAAAKLSRVVGRMQQEALAHRWTQADGAQMLQEILRKGIEGEYRDYISAEQSVMAIDVLLIEAGIADRHRERLDELYRAVRNDDSYSPAQLRGALSALAQALHADRTG